MIKKLLILLVFLSSLSLQARSNFFNDLDDVPIMQGMTMIDNSNIIFDSPLGKFVELYAISNNTSQDIISFYRQALPELGWKEIKNNQFSRDNEQLTLDFYSSKQVQSNIIVRFTLSPQ